MSAGAVRAGWLLAGAVLLGCSPTAAISSAAQRASDAGLAVERSVEGIDSAAVRIQAASKDIAEGVASGSLDGPAVVELAAGVHSDAGTIRSLAASARRSALDVRRSAGAVLDNVAGVEDRVPWWANVVLWVVAGLALLAVVFALWRAGVLSFLGGVFAVVTPRKRSIGALAAQALDPTCAEHPRELVAVLRQDPAVDVPFRAAQTELRKRGAGDTERGSDG